MTDTLSTNEPAVPQRWVTDNDVYSRLVTLWPELGGDHVRRVSVDINGCDVVRINVTRIMREAEVGKFFEVAQQYRLVKASPDVVIGHDGPDPAPHEGFAPQLRIADNASSVIRGVLRWLMQAGAGDALLTAGVDVTDLLQGDLLQDTFSHAQDTWTVTIEPSPRLQEVADALRDATKSRLGA